MIAVSALNVYPVKSCRGIALTEADIGPRGILHDREWLVVTPDGRFLTQRECPRLALVSTEILPDGALCVEFGGRMPLALLAAQEGERCEVTIWRDRCVAWDQGDAAAAWFSAALGRPCRLVRFDVAEVRRVNPEYAVSTDDQVSFTDGYPFLLLSEASLDDLNRRLETPLPMNRFRPNIVVSGCSPYAEDSWQRIRIGEVTFAVVKACLRCAITTTNQQTAQAGKEPLKTLATYRKTEDGVMFGQNLIHLAQGRIRVGDPIEILVP